MVKSNSFCSFLIKTDPFCYFMITTKFIQRPLATSLVFVLIARRRSFYLCFFYLELSSHIDGAANCWFISMCLFFEVALSEHLEPMRRAVDYGVFDSSQLLAYLSLVAFHINYYSEAYIHGSAIRLA
jgi:hypothetical protein